MVRSLAEIAAEEAALRARFDAELKDLATQRETLIQARVSAVGEIARRAGILDVDTDVLGGAMLSVRDTLVRAAAGDEAAIATMNGWRQAGAGFPGVVVRRRASAATSSEPTKRRGRPRKDAAGPTSSPAAVAGDDVHAAKTRPAEPPGPVGGSDEGHAGKN